MDEITADITVYDLDREHGSRDDALLKPFVLGSPQGELGSVAEKIVPVKTALWAGIKIAGQLSPYSDVTVIVATSRT